MLASADAQRLQRSRLEHDTDDNIVIALPFTRKDKRFLALALVPATQQVVAERRRGYADCGVIFARVLHEIRSPVSAIR